jgi:uncharacterized iron-regulated membrane protein
MPAAVWHPSWMTNQLLRTLHAWGGATLALLMLLVSFTGSLLVWRLDYVRLTTPEARVHYHPTVESLALIAQRVETRFGTDAARQIEFPTTAFPLGRVTLDGSRYAYVDVQGKVVAEWKLNGRWEELLYDLHHRLLLENFGLTLVGCAALAMVVLVVAGVVTFWPMRRGFRWRFWPRSGAIRHLREAHRNTGIVVALPLLMSLVTGALLAFPEQSQRLLLDPFRAENYGEEFGENLDEVSGPGTGDWLPALQRASRSFPGAAIRSAQFANALAESRIIGLQQQGELSPQGLSKVYIDAQGGFMDVRIDNQALAWQERVFNAAYPLHTARFDNLGYKLLLTASGLLVSCISVLGLAGFIRSIRRTPQGDELRRANS